MTADAALGFIHQFVPAAQPSEPVTLLLLHGTGGDENDLVPLGKILWPGAALLSPRGKVLENSMPRFFRRFAEGVFDVDDLKFRTHELAEFLDAASRHYRFAKNTLVAVGYSNGANIAASLMLLHPHHLTAAVLFRAMVPFKPDVLPDISGLPVFLAGGTRDQIIGPDQPEQLAALLRAGGAEVFLRWHNGGHELGNDDVDAAKLWLSRQKFGGRA
jgi:predicted esterase